MTQVMQPLPTRYAGVRFRSRLEARWAVLFDHADIQWSYEPQGFIVEPGSYYLPDFWLPGLDSYFEVKGFWCSDLDKCAEFADRLVGQGMYVGVGDIPRPADVAARGWWDADRHEGVTQMAPAFSWDMWFPGGSAHVQAACEAARSARFDRAVTVQMALAAA